MMEDTKAFYNKLEASGIPKRYTHLMPDDSQVRKTSNYYILKILSR